MTNDNLGNGFTYDGASRIAQVNGSAVTYTYGPASGERVRKDVNGQPSTQYRVIFTREGGNGGQDDNNQGWTSVDLSGHVTSLLVGPVMTPAVSSRNMRDIQPAPEVKHTIDIPKIDMLDLRYQIIDHFPRGFSCALAIVPYVQIFAIQAFPEIQKQSAMYDRIIQRLGFTHNGSFSNDDKRMVYQEYSKLAGIKLQLLATKYQFSYGPYIGLMDGAGRIEVVRTSTRSGCPR